MRIPGIWIAALTLACLLPAPAHADFQIDTAIVEFAPGGPAQQDIELVSRSKDIQYIEADVNEVIHPGEANESRRHVDDPEEAGLLVTPDKAVLPGDGRKVLRFVLLKPAAAHERIYRVAVKPVIKGVDNTARIGLKILVGYEILVIVRPTPIAPAYNATRKGKQLDVVNTGNTNILLQAGKQCHDDKDCKPAPVVRVYPGTSATATLPLDAPVTYSVWDGQNAVEKTVQ